MALPAATSPGFYLPLRFPEGFSPGAGIGPRMAGFYLTAAFDPAGAPPPVVAVLLQALRDGDPPGPAQALAEGEWGEREVLRYLVDRGLFDPSDAFVPAGPRVRTTLAQLAERLPRARLRPGAAGEPEGFLEGK